MTADELARIIGAMTERPWAHSEPHGFIVNKQHELGTAETYLYDNSDDNADAIVALANHADAIVELVAACEALAAARCDGPEWGAACGNGWHMAGCQKGASVKRFFAALRAVHAVGKGASDG